MSPPLRAALVALGLVLAPPTWAQTPDSTSVPEAVGVPQALAVPPAAPADSALQAPSVTPADTLPSPSGALRRSLLLPGWGQVYNGQAVKAPLAAGLVAAGVVTAIVIEANYGQYQRAVRYVEFAPGDPATPIPCETVAVPAACNPYAADFDAWDATGRRTASTLKTIRGSFRRARDIAILVTGAVYALQALEAYVAAQLLPFDVSEDLSVIALPTTDGGTVLAIRLGL